MAERHSKHSVVTQFEMSTLQEHEIDLVLPLEYDSQPVVESMPRTDWKWGITTGIVLLGLFVGSAWTLKSELSGVEKHISRVETAVRIIGAKQGGDTKTLIDEAFAVAKNAADAARTESAKAILDIANRLLAEQKASREPVPQEFFDHVVQTYQALKKSPELNDAVWDGTTKLAE